MLRRAAAFAVLAMLPLSLLAADADPAAVKPVYDAGLATSLGADERGMRNYVLVILKTGPNKVTDPAARKKMFEGHFANIGRLAREQKLAFAGPFESNDGWRGMYVFATADVDEAKAWTASDPVIVSGEMVGEYHKLYGSAALMAVSGLHAKIEKK
ncbi:YciI family protein [Massilia sp. CF038]|uniref:YciI family protein n=1 Tax=Massilia sp. CF038 TaxID=1881045 RepID=UPI000912EE71|nr:YciI family protein [Massilia sp. CF038]SHG73802.1 YCII-related domain-containing protein [Massilia sp. CF038]